VTYCLAFLFALAACAQKLDACEDCEMMLEGMPAEIQSSTLLSPVGEPGEPLKIDGIIYKPDGKTPAPGIILYVYHTDATGRYTPGKDQKDARRHGHLRGWVKSDANGRYSFTTIRPASYPNRQDPQHIHPIIREPDGIYYWIDEFLFDDDPKLPARERERQKPRGGSGILHLTKDASGTWIGKRNITLRLNVTP